MGGRVDRAVLPRWFQDGIAVLAVKAVARRSASRLRRALTAALPRALLLIRAIPPAEWRGNMGSEILYVRDQSGDFIVAEGEVVVAAAKTHLSRRVRRGVKLANPKLVRDFLAVTLGDRDCEYFCLILLDAQYRFLRFVELFRGTIDGASVHPREIVKLVLEAQSAAVVLVHNHPSQNNHFSSADEQITQRLKDVLELIDVRVVDHLLVAGSEVVSFAERGLL
jgi:DNA repair protein RadC